MKVEASPGTVPSTPMSKAEPPMLRRKMERKPQTPFARPWRKEKR